MSECLHAVKGRAESCEGPEAAYYRAFKHIWIEAAVSDHSDVQRGRGASWVIGDSFTQAFNAARDGRERFETAGVCRGKASMMLEVFQCSHLKVLFTWGDPWDFGALFVQADAPWLIFCCIAADVVRLNAISSSFRAKNLTWNHQRDRFYYFSWRIL